MRKEGRRREGRGEMKGRKGRREKEVGKDRVIS